MQTPPKPKPRWKLILIRSFDEVSQDKVSADTIQKAEDVIRNLSKRYTHINPEDTYQRNVHKPGHLKKMSEAYDLLLKYVMNLLKPKRPPAWRTINCSNSYFKSRVNCMDGARDILCVIGYSRDTGSALEFPDDVVEPDRPHLQEVAAELLMAKLEMDHLIKETHPHPEQFPGRASDAGDSSRSSSRAQSSGEVAVYPENGVVPSTVAEGMPQGSFTDVYRKASTTHSEPRQPDITHHEILEKPPSPPLSASSSSSLSSVPSEQGAAVNNDLNDLNVTAARVASSSTTQGLDLAPNSTVLNPLHSKDAAPAVTGGVKKKLDILEEIRLKRKACADKQVMQRAMSSGHELQRMMTPGASQTSRTVHFSNVELRSRGPTGFSRMNDLDKPIPEAEVEEAEVNKPPAIAYPPSGRRHPTFESDNDLDINNNNASRPNLPPPPSPSPSPPHPPPAASPLQARSTKATDPSPPPPFSSSSPHSLPPSHSPPRSLSIFCSNCKCKIEPSGVTVCPYCDHPITSDGPAVPRPKEQERGLKVDVGGETTASATTNCEDETVRRKPMEVLRPMNATYQDRSVLDNNNSGGSGSCRGGGDGASGSHGYMSRHGDSSRSSSNGYTESAGACAAASSAEGKEEDEERLPDGQLKSEYMKEKAIAWRKKKEADMKKKTEDRKSVV